MSKVKYDGWCVKRIYSDTLLLPVWDTKEDVIKWYDRKTPGTWEKYNNAGYVKAVKVRIVEVDE